MDNSKELLLEYMRRLKRTLKADMSRDIEPELLDKIETFIKTCTIFKEIELPKDEKELMIESCCATRLEQTQNLVNDRLF